MEPLVTTREAFERDLEQVGRAFLGWRGLEQYVTLPQKAKRALHPYVDRVFDVDQPGDRGEFLSLIRSVAATLPSGPLLQ